MSRAETVLLLVALVLGAPPARAAPVPGVVPDYIAAAVADASRPPGQVAADPARRPAEALAFAGVRPGARVADFMSGGAYFTRLFSRIVGPGGHVYAFLPDEELKNCKPAETAGTRDLEYDPLYKNVTVLHAPVDRFAPPEALDLVWSSLNFHDLYDSFMGPANVPRVTRALYRALKPGGVLLIIDHVAQPGSGTRDTETLHRVDPDTIVHALQQAGFRLESRSALLRNPKDDHRLRVFDPAIRWHTDQAMLRFRKPD